MVVLQNIRFLDHCWGELSLAGGRITHVRRLPAPLAADREALSFAAFLELTQRRACDESLLVDGGGALIAPAGIDVHVHSRDPGMTHKEDWQSLARAAFKGGVTAVVDMPNTVPATLTRSAVIAKANLAAQTELDFQLLLGVSQHNILQLAELLSDESLPLAGLKIYYGQSTGNLMYSDLETLGKVLAPLKSDKILVFHSEDQCRIEERSKCLAIEGAPSAIHSQIRDSQSAWQATARILAWAQTQGQRLHLAHISTPREVELLLAARKGQASLSAEVSPHHLLLSTADYQSLGSLLKVNPPVRPLAEVEQLRQYVAAGYIDCFATDHAPHTLEEKALPYSQCPSGLPSLEFYWPLLWQSALVCKVPLASFSEGGTSVPATLFNFKGLGKLAEGYSADFVWLKEEAYALSRQDITAKCGWSPYEGMRFAVKVAATWKRGKCVYLDEASAKGLVS